MGSGRGGRVLRGGNGLDGGTFAPGLGGLPGQYPARKIIPNGAAPTAQMIKPGLRPAGFFGGAMGGGLLEDEGGGVRNESDGRGGAQLVGD